MHASVGFCLIVLKLCFGLIDFWGTEGIFFEAVVLLER